MSFQSPSRNNRNRLRAALLIGLKLAVSGSLVVYLLRTHRLDLKQFSSAWHSPALFGIAIGLLLVLPLILTLRWRLLLKALGYELPFVRLLRITLAVIFCDTILPGGMADVVRGYSLDREFRPQHRARALSTVVVDRFLGIMGLVMLAVVALLLKSHATLAGSAARSLERGMGVFGVAFLLVFLFLAGKRDIGRGLLERICSLFGPLRHLLTVYDAMRSYASKSSALLLALLLSVAGSLVTITSIFLLGLSLGERNLGAVEYLCLVPIGLAVAQIPIAPGGIGVGHVGFYSLFSLAGSHLGADLFSLFIAARFVSSLPGLFCFLASRRSKNAAPAGAPALPGKASAEAGRLDARAATRAQLNPLPEKP